MTLQQTCKPRRILAVCLGGIGDTVLFSPVIRALHYSHPGAAVELLCSNFAVRELYGAADELAAVHLVNTNRCCLPLKLAGITPFLAASILAPRYALVAMAAGANPRLAGLLRLGLRFPRIERAAGQGEGGTDLERNVALARKFNPAAAAGDVFVPIPAAARLSANETLAAHGLDPDAGKGFIAVYPSSERPNRPRWPLPRLAQALAILRQNTGRGAVAVGSAAEGADWQAADPDGALAVNLCGKISLRQTAAVLAKAALVLGNDGGLLHVAGACGVPLVCVMPNTPSAYCPAGSRTVAVHSPGAPGTYPAPLTQEQRQRCLDGLDDAAILRTCLELLAG